MCYLAQLHSYMYCLYCSFNCSKNWNTAPTKTTQWIFTKLEASPSYKKTFRYWIHVCKLCTGLQLHFLLGLSVLLVKLI